MTLEAGPVRRELYPAINPYQTGMLAVGGGHEIYFEQSGNPHGKPVVFLHGGPGGGTSGNQRRFFDPAAYRIVLLDQRGCGKSRPHSSLEANTTQHLIDDLEKLRRHIGIERWMVFGGSWGSTLALAYAETYPERVSALVLRGLFLCRRQDIDWFYRFGASELFPEHFENFMAPLAARDRADPVAAYYALLTGADQALRQRAAISWCAWESHTVTLMPGVFDISGKMDPALDALARIEAHYFKYDGFLEPDQLLRDIVRIRHIPAVIVQGRYDVVCPVRAAFDLKRVFPEADLIVCPDAGHSAFEPSIADALVRATDRFRNH